MVGFPSMGRLSWLVRAPVWLFRAGNSPYCSAIGPKNAEEEVGLAARRLVEDVRGASNAFQGHGSCRPVMNKRIRLWMLIGEA